MKFTVFIVAFLQFFFFVQGQSDTILNRYKAYLQRTGTARPELVSEWVNQLNNAGQWPDIQYNDHTLAGWKVSNHLVRIREMALAWSGQRSIWYRNKQLWHKLNRALDHWCQKRYQSANWWHNEIGVPRCMRDIIMLLRNDLARERLQQAMEVMSQLRVHEDYVGGNLVWCADLGLHYGALTRNEKLVRRCRELILQEIKIGTGEGIQPDYSFHQHGKRLQMYQYGKAFIGESLRVAWQCRGTPLAFPKEKVTIMTDFVINGWQWMARGIHTVPGTMDRSASRKGELRSADLRPLIPFMIELQEERAAELKAIATIQDGNNSLVGYRYYPYSDFVAFHRPGFSFFCKSISARTYATESINQENLKGKLLHSGDAYLVRNGQEYFNLLPLWDWTCLPGVTAFKEADQAERNHFVGSVSGGSDGFSVMDLGLKDKTGNATLSARKLWACHQDVVVCLIAGIQTKGVQGPVYTALDQCRRQGPVTVNKVRNVMLPGLHRLAAVKWLHHAGFAYIPLQPAFMELHLKEVSGTWTSINASESTEPLTDELFLPVLLHDSTQTSTGYALALCETPKLACKMAAHPTWKIIRNDKEGQAVLFNDGALMAAFYTPGKLEAGKGFHIETNQPCLILLQNGQLYTSDPSHKGITVTITLNTASYTVFLPPNGFTTHVQVKSN